ncbi:MAG: toxin-antitoxin system YwqK family antitoxin, partial [Bacteroidota bacterium]
MKYMLLLFIHLLSQLVFAQGNFTKIKYPNGQIQSIGKFNLAGKEDSIWNYYYENGALQEVANYTNGYLNGSVIRYHMNGNIQTKGFFKYGVQDSIFITYNESAKVIETGQYQAGIETGIWKYFNEEGSVKKEIEFTADGMLLLTFRDSKGSITITNGLGELIEYHESGTLKSKTPYVN